MALDPRIILAGQTPDIMGSMSRGMAVGQQQNQIGKENALASLYQTQGAGIAAGEPGALNALAGIDPMAAMGVQSNRLGMDAQRLGMDATRQSMTLQSEQAKRQAAEYAKGLSAEQRMAEAAQLEQGLSGAAFFYSKGDRQGYEAFLQQNGIDPAQFSFDQFPAHAATMGGVLEVLKTFTPEPYKPQSALGKFEADRAAGAVPAGAEFKSEGTTVINNMGEGSKFYDELDKGQAGMFQTLMDEGVQAGRTLQQVDRLDQILKATPTGAVAAFKTMLGEYGIPTEGLDNLQAAQALVNQIVPQQRQPGSGPMSDADLALFKQSVPRLINQPGGNEIIISRMRAISQYQMQQADIASRVANRTMSPVQGREALAALANPLEGFSGNASPANTAASPPASKFSTMPMQDLLSVPLDDLSVEELRAYNEAIKRGGQ